MEFLTGLKDGQTKNEYNIVKKSLQQVLYVWFSSLIQLKSFDTIKYLLFSRTKEIRFPKNQLCSLKSNNPSVQGTMSITHNGTSNNSTNLRLLYFFCHQWKTMQDIPTNYDIDNLFEQVKGFVLFGHCYKCLNNQLCRNCIFKL